MSSEIFFLHKFIDEEYITRDGTFVTLGSAKVENRKNVLCYAVSLEYIKIAEANPNISVIITIPSLKNETTKSLVIHEEPDILFGQILNELILKEQIKPEMDYGVSNSAIIDPSAHISLKSFIGNNVKIGRNVIVNDYSIIEDNCIIGDKVVIGCDGFYFKRNKQGELVKFLHAGGVHLHKDVEILTGSIIQRAHDKDFTTIGRGTKISVNVNIGHSSRIGKHNMITGNVQIAGRVVIGDYCWIGVSSTVSDSVKIANNVKVKIGSVVVRDVKESEEVSGNFAYNHTKRIRNFVKDQR